MQENESAIVEKPSTHKLKMQRWLMYTLGVIFVFLLVLTIMNIFKRADEKQGNAAETEEAITFSEPAVEANREPDNPFANIRTPTEQATDGTRVVNQQIPQATLRSRAESPTGQTFNQVSDQAIASIEQSRQAKAPAQDELAEAIAQWRIQEELRGLNSLKTGFNFGGSINQAQAKPATAADPAAGFDQQLADIEQRRMDISQRIAEAERLRSNLINQNGNIDDVQRQLTGLQTEFSAPPVDVAGYSKENEYNSDIAGKIAIPAGEVMDAIFTFTTVSDYAGSTVKGMITRDVYDVNKQFVLLPKGTELILTSLQINNVNEPIQARMGFVVKWAVLPNGKKVDFSKAAFADRQGIGAIKDKVNRHLVAQFLGVAAYALLSSETSRSGSGFINDSTYEAEVGESLRSQFAPLAQKYLNLVPTITIRNGQTFKLVLEDEIFVDPWSDIYETYY